MEYLLIIISAIFVNNILLAQFLGICPFLGVSKNTKTAAGMGGAVISYISEKRTYEGGLMFPGVRLSLDALSHHTAQLPNISLEHPKQLIGKNTEECMRSGIVDGTAAMLDGVIDRIRETLHGAEPSIVATGPNAPVIARYCRNRVVYDKYLLMEGLYTIYQKNRK